MRKKRINKIFGIILALSLPITLIGAVTLMVMFPSQQLFTDMGWNRGGMHNQWMQPWTQFDDWGHMNNGHMNNSNHMGSNSVSTNMIDGDLVSYENIQSLQVKGMVDDVKVELAAGDQVEFSYSGEETLRLSVNGSKIIISNTRSGMNFNTLSGSGGELIIRIPSNFKKLELDAAASHMTLSDITVQELDVDLGVGNLDIKAITVSGDTDIDGGKGNIRIVNSTLNIVDIDGGMGSIALDAVQAQKVEIDAGVGSISLMNSTIDYLKTDRGIGSINLDNNTIREHKEN